MSFFTFDKEKPTKAVMTNTLSEIAPEWQCDPLVWTPQLKPFHSRRVFLVCSKTSKGRDTFRFYPLQKRADKTPPAFVIVANDDKLVEHPATHVVFRHQLFTIIRPLFAVYYKAKRAVELGELDYIPQNLLTLVKHSYFTDLIDDEFIDEVEAKFQKLEKVIALTSSSMDGESHNAHDKALRLCQSILGKIRTEVNKNGHEPELK